MRTLSRHPRSSRATIVRRRCIACGLVTSLALVLAGPAGAQDGAAIARAYVQAITGGSGSRVAGSVDFAALGCTPATVWENCQQAVADGKDGKTFMMDAITTGNVHLLLPERDVARVLIDSDGTYENTRAMFGYLSTAGNGWYTEHEGSDGPKGILRRYIAAVPGRAIARAYVQSIAGGSGSRRAGSIDFMSLGCTPASVWEDCQSPVWDGTDGKTFLMQTVNAVSVRSLIPPEDMMRILFGAARYEPARDLLGYLTTDGNGWFAEMEGPGRAKAVLRGYTEQIFDEVLRPREDIQLRMRGRFCLDPGGDLRQGARLRLAGCGQDRTVFLIEHLDGLRFSLRHANTGLCAGVRPPGGIQSGGPTESVVVLDCEGLDAHGAWEAIGTTTGVRLRNAARGTCATDLGGSTAYVALRSCEDSAPQLFSLSTALNDLQLSVRASNPARNIVSQLDGLSARTPVDGPRVYGETEQWGSLDATGHIQGVAVLEDGRYVLPTSLAVGRSFRLLLAVADPNGRIFARSVILDPARGYAGGADAAGNVVVLGTGGTGLVKFFRIDRNDIVELDHLELSCGEEFPAIAYHPGLRSYFVTACGKLWRSSVAGRNLSRSGCEPCWTEVGDLGGSPASDGGRSLIYDSTSGDLYWFGLYEKQVPLEATVPTPTGLASGSVLTAPADGGERIAVYRVATARTPRGSGGLATSVQADIVMADAQEVVWGPSFRYGGAVHVDENGNLVVVASIRDLRSVLLFDDDNMSWYPLIYGP